MKLIDSMKNFVSGLGTALSKNSTLQYGFNELSPEQLIAAYRGDWIARKLVDIPAEDATREWRTWEAEKEQISLLEAEEAKHNLKQKTEEALIRSRLLGGGALVIGVDGAGDWSEPLVLDRVKRGSLKYIHVVDRYELSTGQLNRDLLSPYFGEPIDYRISSQSVGMVTIHPSRMVKFVAKKIPLRQLEVDGWGDSVLQALDAAVKNAGLASEGIAELINEASIDVMQIPDLMTNLSTAEYKDLLISRFQLAKVSQSLVRTKIMDKEETYNKVATNFANLPEVIKVYLQIAAGAGDVPATRFLGQSPSGLNATGDSDTRNYYDSVGAMQKNKITPAMTNLDEVIIRSALGERPEEIHYNWVSLWQPTSTEKAAVLLSRSQAVANIFNTGYVPDEVMSKGVQNMLIEDGSFPGLESAIDEYKELGLDEDDPEVKAQFAGE